ncbi:MAG: kinase/pyrophosphorylase [Candidatus Eisenbacteria sp.]|nr:kinase/pyrophosphorylase [Candidatus Eisenbacteria bacterium]
MAGRSDPGQYRHVFAVSDGTAQTCELVLKSALSQFEPTRATVHRVPSVRTRKQVEDLMEEVTGVNGVVVYTMVSPELRHVVTELGRARGVPTVDILGPILTRLTDLLELSPLARPGVFRQLDQEYFRRIEAMDFAVKHDDGQDPEGWLRAELILVGVSRTSKTPLSIYLAYRGWRVANVPLVPGVDPHPVLFEVDPQNVIALTMTPERLMTIREERAASFECGNLESYVSYDSIRREVVEAMKLFGSRGWPVLDMTHKSVEEAATELMRITWNRRGVRKGPGRGES